MTFTQNIINKLKKKLLISNNMCDQYLLEYKKFLFMAACSSYLIIPSKQVEHVWLLHMQETAKYREDTCKLFGSLFRYTPYYGGQKDIAKFELASKNTLSYYEAMFGKVPELW